MKLFNKASKMLSDYFKHDTNLDKDNQVINIEDNIIYLSSQLILWKDDKNYDDESFNSIFNFRFNKKFMIYNLNQRKINFKKDHDKIIDFVTPDHPSFSLEFLLTFSISAKNWLSLDECNVLIIHDQLKSPRVISLICVILSYLNKNQVQPMDIYANIITTNKAFAELANITLYKNVRRYINYFSILQMNPLISYKQLYLKSIIINGAPAIQNKETSNHFITINSKSYYKPVIRIISNDKVAYCSYKKYFNF